MKLYFAVKTAEVVTMNCEPALRGFSVLIEVLMLFVYTI